MVVKFCNLDGEFFNRLKCFLEEERRIVLDMNRVFRLDVNCFVSRVVILFDFWIWV